VPEELLLMDPRGVRLAPYDDPLLRSDEIRTTATRLIF
jgi:hypothetical protein